MSRRKRRNAKRVELRIFKGERVQAVNKSQRLSEIKRKSTRDSFFTTIIIGLVLSVVYLLIKK